MKSYDPYNINYVMLQLSMSTRRAEEKRFKQKLSISLLVCLEDKLEIQVIFLVDRTFLPFKYFRLNSFRSTV